MQTVQATRDTDSDDRGSEEPEVQVVKPEHLGGFYRKLGRRQLPRCQRIATPAAAPPSRRPRWLCAPGSNSPPPPPAAGSPGRRHGMRADRNAARRSESGLGKPGRSRSVTAKHRRLRQPARSGRNCSRSCASAVCCDRRRFEEVARQKFATVRRCHQHAWAHVLPNPKTSKPHSPIR